VGFAVAPPSKLLATKGSGSYLLVHVVVLTVVVQPMRDVRHPDEPAVFRAAEQAPQVLRPRGGRICAERARRVTGVTPCSLLPAAPAHTCIPSSDDSLPTQQGHAMNAHCIRCARSIAASAPGWVACQGQAACQPRLPAWRTTDYSANVY
jgi:hypothetical protein